VLWIRIRSDLYNLAGSASRAYNPDPDTRPDIKSVKFYATKIKKPILLSDPIRCLLRILFI
jgi:hypothetical protein